MSWAQVDNSVNNDRAKTTTNEGSKSFLQGAISIQQSMIYLDDNRIEEASRVGLESVEHFNKAQGLFQEVIDMVRDDALRDAFAEYLRGVNYRSKEDQLVVRPETSYVWTSLQLATLRDGIIGLFETAVARANRRSRTSEVFFNEMKNSGRYEPMERSRLLAQVGSDLVFGAYISAILSK